MSNWQLPEGIDELTGNQANAFESARRELLDLYQSWGYEIVVPPMIEYADNLVLNSKSIDDKTFNATMQLFKDFEKELKKARLEALKKVKKPETAK